MGVLGEGFRPSCGGVVEFSCLGYLSLPDPTVDRATGFVRASVRSNSATGTTLRLPYFIVLGDHADLTLTPGITIAGNANPLNTIEGRFRRAFAYGDLEVNAAISRDDLTSARARLSFRQRGLCLPIGVEYYVSAADNK